MVPDEPRIEPVSATAWSGATADQRSVDHLLPEQLLAVIEALVINEVPQELDRWLCSLLLQLRHIDIVYENSNCLIRPCAKKSLSLLV
jgi:hypothetical protein